METLQKGDKEILYIEKYLDKGFNKDRLVILDMASGEEKFVDDITNTLSQIFNLKTNQNESYFSKDNQILSKANISLKTILDNHYYSANEDMNELGLFGIEIDHTTGSFTLCDLYNKTENGFMPIIDPQTSQPLTFKDSVEMANSIEPINAQDAQFLGSKNSKLNRNSSSYIQSKQNEMVYCETYLDENHDSQRRLVILDLETGDERWEPFTTEGIQNAFTINPNNVRASADPAKVPYIQKFLARHSFDANQNSNENGLYGINISKEAGTGNSTYTLYDLEQKEDEQFKPLTEEYTQEYRTATGEIKQIKSTKQLQANDIYSLGMLLDKVDNKMLSQDTVLQDRPNTSASESIEMTR